MILIAHMQARIGVFLAHFVSLFFKALNIEIYAGS